MSTKHFIAAAVTAAALIGPTAAQAACADADLVLTAATASKVQDATVCLVNEQRAANGASALRVNGKLVKAAKVHTADMVAKNFNDHTGSDGSTPFERMRRAGYRFTAAAENIAWGYTTAAKTVDGWMHSSGHRKNILNKTYTEVGMSAAMGGQAVHTMTFGRR